MAGPGSAGRGRGPAARAARLALGGERSRRVDIAFRARATAARREFRHGPEAELVFFSGAYPLRAIVKQRHGAPAPPERISGYAKIIDAHEAFTSAMAANPWLEKFPMPLLNVTPASAAATRGLFETPKTGR